MVLRLPLTRAGNAPDIRLDARRLYLRPPQERDWRPWAELRQQSRAFLVPWEPTWPSDVLTLESFRRRLRRYYQNWRSDQGYAYFLFRRGDDAVVGGVTVSNLRRGVVQSASLGYWVGEPHAQNGYMTEAIEALLPFTFDRLGLHRLEAACLPNNEPSQCLLRRTGFEREGLARKYLCINGAWRDHVLFAQLGEDWRARAWHRHHEGRGAR